MNNSFNIKDIIILTDSRGYCPGDNKNWVDLLYNTPNFNITKYNWVNGTASTITKFLNILKNNNKTFDLIIYQCGFHEYVYNWPKKIIGFKVKKSDPNFEKYIHKYDNHTYTYKNDQLICEKINELKKYAKYILFITIHNINGMANIHKKDKLILHANKIFGKHMDQLILPMHYSWKNYFCYDHIHYNNTGHKFIYNFIIRYIKRINININQRLQYV